MSNHRDRYRQIAETLSRHGLGYLVGVLGLERRVPFHRGLLGHEAREEPYTQPEHLRLALEQLGATFVKLGQILSTRSDLLGPEYQVELAKLQDAAPAVPGDEISELITRELGQEPEAAFASFEIVPLAAASIGQAYAATLLDGTEVVVKVRRPGVVEQVEEDLEILRNLAAHASRHWPAAADYDVVGLVDDRSAGDARRRGSPRASASDCDRKRPRTRVTRPGASSRVEGKRAEHELSLLLLWKKQQPNRRFRLA